MNIVTLLDTTLWTKLGKASNRVLELICLLSFVVQYNPSNMTFADLNLQDNQPLWNHFLALYGTYIENSAQRNSRHHSALWAWSRHKTQQRWTRYSLRISRHVICRSMYWMAVFVLYELYNTNVVLFSKGVSFSSSDYPNFAAFQPWSSQMRVRYKGLYWVVSSS